MCVLGFSETTRTTNTCDDYMFASQTLFEGLRETDMN